MKWKEWLKLAGAVGIALGGQFATDNQLAIAIAQAVGILVAATNKALVKPAAPPEFVRGGR